MKRSTYYMRMMICLVSLFTCMVASAQDDEIPTYHNKLQGFSKIKEPEIRADLAAFTLGGLDESVGKTPLAYLPVASYDANSIVLANDNIRVSITSGPFNQNNHKIQRYEQYVVRIDNKPFYGVNGQMPKRAITSIVAVIRGDSVRIPPVAYQDLFEPRFARRKAVER